MTTCFLWGFRHFKEVAQYDSVAKSDGLFAKYINTFLQLKQEVLLSRDYYYYFVLFHELVFMFFRLMAFQLLLLLTSWLRASSSRGMRARGLNCVEEKW